MNKWTGNLPYATAVAVMCISLSHASADALAKTQALLLQQSAYFQKIGTVDFAATKRITLCDARRAAQGAPANTYTSSVRFRYKDGKFLTEVTSPDWQTPNKTATVAYDGTLYQFLGDGSLVTGSGRLAGVPYGASLPPFDIFCFVMQPSDELSLTTLRSSQKWLDLAARITDCAPSTKLGYDGYALTFEMPSTAWPGTDRAQHEVFLAAALDYLPVYWRTTANGSNGLTTVESEVRETRLVTAGSEQLRVPVSVKTTEILAGETQEDVLVTVQSIGLNGEIDDGIFRLSVPQPSASSADVN